MVLSLTGVIWRISSISPNWLSQRIRYLMFGIIRRLYRWRMFFVRLRCMGRTRIGRGRKCRRRLQCLCIHRLFFIYNMPIRVIFITIRFSWFPFRMFSFHFNSILFYIFKIVFIFIWSADCTIYNKIN